MYRCLSILLLFCFAWECLGTFVLSASADRVGVQVHDSQRIQDKDSITWCMPHCVDEQVSKSKCKAINNRESRVRICFCPRETASFPAIIKCMKSKCSPGDWKRLRDYKAHHCNGNSHPQIEYACICGMEL